MDVPILKQLLSIYYRSKFPLSLWCRWVAAGCSPLPLANRELSFTLADDVYIRYLSIKRANDLKTLLQKRCPYKIDIGAVYDSEPSIAKQGSTVLARELVFDIDLTDYDDVRTCCQGADICQKCWKFMVVACQVLDRALIDDFGFTGVLWVYSGRRGIHCWVSCAEARSLSSAGRGAVADYLAVVSGGESQAKKVHLNSDNIHTSIKFAIEIIDKIFEEILEDQQFFSTPEGLGKLLKLIPDETFAAQVKKTIEELTPDSVLRWKAFEQIYKTFCREHTSNRRMKHLLEEIKLQLCYPRLDINVTKGLNHLLKAPFSVHPKTEKICVVFPAERVASFQPDSVPLLNDLVDDETPNHSQAVSSMQESVAIFQQHVFNLEKHTKRKRENGDTLDF